MWTAVWAVPMWVLCVYVCAYMSYEVCICVCAYVYVFVHVCELECELCVQSGSWSNLLCFWYWKGISLQWLSSLRITSALKTGERFLVDDPHQGNTEELSHSQGGAHWETSGVWGQVGAWEIPAETKWCRGRRGEKEGGREEAPIWQAPCLHLKHKGHLWQEEWTKRAAKRAVGACQGGRINLSHPSSAIS